MSLVDVTLVVTDETIPEGLGLSDVVVRIYNADGTVFVTEGTTDSSGIYALDLEDNTTYWVRFFKIGYRFASRLRINVDSTEVTNSFTVTGMDLTTYPPATDPNMCRASGSVLNARGAPAPGVTFEFLLTGSPRVVGRRVMVVSKALTRSDSAGDLDIDLVRNGIYDVIVEGHAPDVFRVKVPDYAYVDVTALIWPYVTSVSFDTTSVSLAPAASVTVQATLTLSSRTVVPYELDNGDQVLLTDFVDITSEDTSVADVSIGEDGLLTITAVASGATTISVTLREGVTAKREPTPTTILGSVAVVVT